MNIEVLLTGIVVGLALLVCVLIFLTFFHMLGEVNE